MTSDLAIDALLMTVWRRKPKQEVMVHSDQGSQYSSSVEMFYNVKRRHGFNNQLSPVEFGKRYAMSLQGV